MNIEFSPLLSRQWNALRIELFDSGYARLGTEWNQEHLSPPFSRLYYITGGAGVVEGGSQRLSLEPGFVYLLPLHLSLRYGCAEEIEQVYFHIAARTDAEKRTILAEAEASVKRIEADADAYKVKVQSEAEAAANKLIASSLTDSLIRYTQANRWNGSLPQIVGNSTALPVLDLTGADAN